jgi:nucleoid-associated protein EbfC
MKDVMGLMKQAQNLQQKMAELQQQAENLESEGISGAGMVKVTMNAKGVMRTITIDPSLLRVEEKDILEDLIVAATNDARQRGEKLMQERMQELTRGLPLPPGLNLF